MILDVRLKHMTKKAKLDILAGPYAAAKAALMFPRPGDELKVHLSPALGDSTQAIRVKVDGGQQKAKLSPIARLVVTIL